MKTTPQTRARERAGFTLEQAARRVKCRATTKPENAVRHLRRIELKGDAGDLIGRQLATLYGCREDLFFFSPDFWEEWQRAKGIDPVTGERVKPLAVKTGVAPVAGTDGAVPMKASAFDSLRGADTPCPNTAGRAARRTRPSRRPHLEAI